MHEHTNLLLLQYVSRKVKTSSFLCYADEPHGGWVGTEKYGDGVVKLVMEKVSWE